MTGGSSSIRGRARSEKLLINKSYKIALTSLLCVAALWFAWSATVSLSPWILNSNTASSFSFTGSSQCNYSHGRWEYDPSLAPRYDKTCKEIFKGWNCIASNKPNAKDIYKWRWRPWDCDLPPLDPHLFFTLFRNIKIGFVGDSLNRNMFVALVCTLRKVSEDVKKWRPVRADRGFTFLKYNLTVAYHRTNLLVKYGRWSAGPDNGPLERLGYKEGFRVDVDVPDVTWAEAPNYYDVLIFNTGHWWWSRTKFDPVKSPMLFFKKGLPILPSMQPEEGLDIALKNMIQYVEKVTTKKTLKIFRTQSPRHFEGGDWNSGGKCSRPKPLALQEVYHLFTTGKNGTNVEGRLANSHLVNAVRNSSFYMLDITAMSEFRADAHPSKWGGKKHEDCMHWCLPGLTDYWNDLLMVILLEHTTKKIYNFAFIFVFGLLPPCFFF